MLCEGIATILDGQSKSSPDAGAAPSTFQLQSSLDAERIRVEGHEFELLKQEINFDERAWDVYQRKVSEFDLRMLHLKDEWLHKRYGVVKQAAQSFLDTRVTLLAYPEKFGPGTALETCDEIKKESEQWLKKLNRKSMVWGVKNKHLYALKFLLVSMVCVKRTVKAGTPG